MNERLSEIIEKIHNQNNLLGKLFICNSKEELNKITESAENLLLQYTVQKHHDSLWYVTVYLQ